MSLWDKLWSGKGNRTKGSKTIVISPLPEEVKAEALRAEQEAYLRRVGVCTELRRVAVERGDESLYRQADELEREAESLYRLRVGRLGLQVPAESRPARAGSPASREEEIRAAATRLSPPLPVPAGTEARIREVKP